MSLAKKLNLKAVRVIGKPAGVDLGDVTIAPGGKADAVLVFVKTLAEVDAKSEPAITAAETDRIAYPKAGQLGTNLNRDVLWKHMQRHGIQAARQVALDDVWSALRFRPKA